MRIFRHDIDRQVVHHAAIHEQMAVMGDRRQNAGQRHAGAQSAPQRTGPVHMDAPGREIGRHAEERLRQFLDARVAVIVAQEIGDLAPAHERDEREGVIGQRIGLDEGCAHAVGQFVDGPFGRETGRDERAHAGAAQLIDRHARFVQRLQDADMGEAARAAAGQHQTDRASRYEPRQTAHVFIDAGADMVMGLEETALEREMFGQAAALAVGMQQQKLGQSRRARLEGRHFERPERQRAIRARQKEHAIGLPADIAASRGCPACRRNRR